MEKNFPKISAKNLEGDSLELPHDLEGTLNIIIIAFKREQQSLVDDWIPYLEDYIKKNLQIAYYEIPTIHFSYLPLRWMIDGGMRAGIADKKARQRTITLYINKKKFTSHKFGWQNGYAAFSYSRSHRDNVISYIQNQEEHHRRKTFKEEYLELLEKFQIEYQDQYLFDFLDIDYL